MAIRKLPITYLCYHMGKACYRLALRPLVNPDLTLRLLEPDYMHLLEFLANFKSELQCSCLNSFGTKRCFPKCTLRFSKRAVHLPRCRLVSYSSPQRGHIDVAGEECSLYNGKFTIMQNTVSSASEIMAL